MSTAADEHAASEALDAPTQFAAVSTKSVEQSKALCEQQERLQVTLLAM
jgi:hypothetical protein